MASVVVTTVELWCCRIPGFRPGFVLQPGFMEELGELIDVPGGELVQGFLQLGRLPVYEAESIGNTDAVERMNDFLLSSENPENEQRHSQMMAIHLLTRCVRLFRSSVLRARLRNFF